MMRFAADAVVEHAGGGGGEGTGEDLEDDGESHGLGLAAGEFEQEIVDGQGVEPVAEFAHDLGHPEEAVVAIVAEEREVSGEHGEMDKPGGLSYVYRPMRCLTVRTVLVGDGGDAFGAFAQNAGEIGGVGGDFAITLLEGFQVGDHHFGDLLLQIAIAHAGKACS